jgi:hypothetical protein
MEIVAFSRAEVMDWTARQPRLDGLIRLHRTSLHLIFRRFFRFLPPFFLIFFLSVFLLLISSLAVC